MLYPRIAAVKSQPGPSWIYLELFSPITSTLCLFLSKRGDEAMWVHKKGFSLKRQDEGQIKTIKDADITTGKKKHVMMSQQGKGSM